jgi:cystathionine gamma-lyase
MKLPLDLHPQTLAIHAGQEPDPTTGAIMTPIYQTSTYVQQSPGVNKGFEYARTRNPTRDALEQNLAALEGAPHGLAFASGCGAMATVMHLFQTGDHFVVCDDVYGGTVRLFTKVFEKCGFNFSFVDMTQAGQLEKAITPQTKMIWVETPTNPMMKVIDIAYVVGVAQAHSKGNQTIKVLVDNTFMSPLLQTPIKLGADFVLESTTKYIGGHSDVVGGFVACAHEADYKALQFNQKSIGATPGPFDCFLTLRGTKTLPVRMQQHCLNAQKIAEFLNDHSQIERVYYPGLASHPQHEVAKKQMKGFGGMMSFVVKGGLPAARKVLESVKIFALAESLGGVESLIEHPAIMTHASVPAEMRAKTGIVDGLIRVSVGIEFVDDLIKDLDQALKAAK